MIIARTLCAHCGREIDERQAFIREGVPYCCESCADTGRCERGCGSDMLEEDPEPARSCA
jgi:hypothetical protein